MPEPEDDRDGDGVFRAGKLTIIVESGKLWFSMDYWSEGNLYNTEEVLETPDIIRLGLWLAEHRPK